MKLKEIFLIVFIIIAYFAIIILMFMVRASKEKTKETKQIMNSHITTMFDAEHLYKLQSLMTKHRQSIDIPLLPLFSIKPPSQGESVGPKDAWGNYTFYYYGKTGNLPFCIWVSSGLDGKFHTHDDILVMPNRK